ncbi:putative Glutamyl-tRNA amidotransferase subunit A [Cadophora sp. DSE1049]|nr:putative Glutamyl-tRNA amidotransferase subunit A [Cadophora sp. DSE1049]
MAFSVVRAAITALSLTAYATALVSPAGHTVVVNGITYWAAPEPVSIISATADQLKSAATTGVDLIPLTVMEDKSSSFTTAVFRSLAGNYTASDDVFNIGFLQAVYLKHSGTAPATVKYPLGAALTEYGTKLFMSARAYQSSVEAQGYSITGWRTELPAGPYFMSTSTGEVYQAYRLYSDVQGAFTEGLKPNTDGSFSVLSASVSGVQSVTIGVPSKLYFTKTAAKPLAGVRVGIKDIYDIAGVKTSCGNRAYFDLYPARSKTATAVQNLIDAGAVVVGKMKTSQFANGESATSDWVDYHCPFNPRGDGYQDPSSSSSGPGAGIAAYEWLDLTLGSDTGGSIRGPSGVNGCYGNRPSTGLVSLDNTMPLSPDMDTAGFLVRDPLLWHTAAKAMYKENINSNFTSFPKKILTTGFPTSATSEAGTVLLDFLTKLSTFLNATTSALDINTLWSSTRPTEAAGNSLSQFMGTVYPILISQQQYRLFTLPFYSDYAAAHDGRRPFINPVPLTRWAYGQSFPATAEEQALANKTVFTDWWNSNVVLESEESCSESILLYPGASGNPNYRNTYRSAPGAPTGFSIGRVSNFAGVPDIVYPLGQASYQSTITLKTEFLPVTVDIVAAKGCDGMLFELAAALNKAGILKVPKTGSETF